MIKIFVSILWAGWKKLGYAFGQVLGLFIFSAIYFLGIGFYALLALALKQLITKRIPATLWQIKPYRQPSLENLEKQF